MPLARSSRRPLLAAGLAVVLALGAVACGDDADTTEAGGPGTGTSSAPDTTAGDGDADGGVTTDGLDGRAFVGTTVTEDGQPKELAAGTELRLAFEEGQLSADAGCNSMGGPYSMDGEVLVVESLSQTEMACVPEDRMEQDTWFADLLTSGPTVVVDGDQLVLTADTTVITLTDEEVAVPDVPLVGTAWELDTVISGGASSSASASSDDGTASSTEAGIVLTLGYDGAFTVAGSCALPPNGTYVLGTESDVVTFAMDTSAAVCLRGQTEAEQALTTVLSAPEATYEVDRDRLTLMVGDQGVSLRAQA